jgi:uncharacterized iron-regulated protein
MKPKFLLVVLLLYPCLALLAQDKPAYTLFDSRGKKVSYDKMINRLKENDIVLFGEFHNNPIVHWLQLEVTRDLQSLRPLLLGAEMFEQDNQEALNRYLDGSLSAKGLDSSARLWPNYKTDYAPLVNFARANRIPFVATNIPRRFASMVARGGFEALDTLSEQQKKWMAPLPPAYDSTLPGYKNMMTMMAGHASPNLPKAQAIKDATMAWFILKNYKPGSLFLHFNGAYHSQNYEGILWYLRQQQPGLKYATINTVSQKDLRKLLDEHKGSADFIICVDEDMTTTY